MFSNSEFEYGIERKYDLLPTVTSKLLFVIPPFIGLTLINFPFHSGINSFSLLIDNAMATEIYANFRPNSSPFNYTVPAGKVWILQARTIISNLDVLDYLCVYWVRNAELERWAIRESKGWH